MWTVTTWNLAADVGTVNIPLGWGGEQLPPRQPALLPDRERRRPRAQRRPRRSGAARGGAPQRRLAQRGLPALRRPGGPAGRGRGRRDGTAGRGDEVRDGTGGGGG